MSGIKIQRARQSDIPLLEEILLDNVTWVDEMGQPLWKIEDVKWLALSKSFQIDDFYIAYKDGIPSGCMALIDYDPFFWPDVKKGESLFIHKLAVTKAARKSGVSEALLGFSKEQGAQRGIKTIRLDTDAQRPKTRAFYERNGFAFISKKEMGSFHVAFYAHYLHDAILVQNKSSWNAMADCWFGTTALPTYGCSCPSEDDLHLFPELFKKKVLDIGCGSGHSLRWCGDRGASELWGLDMSSHQLENADRYLRENDFIPTLFCSPMEDNPGIPVDYFDVAYSIYAIGWTVDLQKTFTLIASYLKPGGIFIFSWDHPFLHCLDVDGEQLVISGSYYETEPFTFHKGENRQQVRKEKSSGTYSAPDGGYPLTLYNRRISDYVNALAIAGFAVERIVEETDKETLERDAEFSSEYYAPCKAQRFPLSLIIKARKL